MALHPAAVVVRAGQVRDVDELMSKVLMSIEDGDGACISVFCDVDKTDAHPGMTLHRLCAESSIPNGQVQLSTVARVNAAGFELDLDTSDDQARTHHNVNLRAPVEESQLLEFIGCFDEPIANPVPKRQRKRGD